MLYQYLYLKNFLYENIQKIMNIHSMIYQKDNILLHQYLEVLEVSVVIYQTLKVVDIMYAFFYI